MREPPIVVRASWSPESRRIAWGNGAAVWVMNADGTHTQLVSRARFPQLVFGRRNLRERHFDATRPAARLSRAAGIMLVVVVPIVVSPWGSDGYNQVKALAAETLAAVAVIGWVGAGLTAGRPSCRCLS